MKHCTALRRSNSVWKKLICFICLKSKYHYSIIKITFKCIVKIWGAYAPTAPLATPIYALRSSRQQGPLLTWTLVRDIASLAMSQKPFRPCSVLFFSRRRSAGWPHHGRTFFIYLCPLSFWLTYDSSTGSPVQVLMLSTQAVHGLPRLRVHGIVASIISFSRQLPCFIIVWS